MYLVCALYCSFYWSSARFFFFFYIFIVEAAETCCISETLSRREIRERYLASYIFQETFESFISILHILYKCKKYIAYYYLLLSNNYEKAMKDAAFHDHEGSF